MITSTTSNFLYGYIKQSRKTVFPHGWSQVIFENLLCRKRSCGCSDSDLQAYTMGIRVVQTCRQWSASFSLEHPGRRAPLPLESLSIHLYLVWSSMQPKRWMPHHVFLHHKLRLQSLHPNILENNEPGFVEKTFSSIEFQSRCAGNSLMIFIAHKFASTERSIKSYI